MRRSLVFVGVLVALCARTTTPAASAEPTDQLPQYLIELKQIETGPDGREQVLSSPQLVTLEGHSAAVEVTCRVPSPKDSGLKEPLTAGSHAQIRVFRNGERLFLDASFNRAVVRAESEDGVRIASVGMRVVESLTLGRTIEVPLAGKTAGGQPSGRFEVVVTKVAMIQPPPPATRVR